ncbi:hypothetical protein GQ44DRAFT_605779 [Phaeosphaeriaceae sp. PMI808]|nr:hypothetical protein GQ44DRAFT_605779 [Phaeosphaeriaceae sp. PMI808]
MSVEEDKDNQTSPAPKRSRQYASRVDPLLSALDSPKPITDPISTPTPPPSPPPQPHIFPFMRLPAELRLHIYYMALVRTHPLSLHIPRFSSSPPSPVPSPLLLKHTTTTSTTSTTTSSSSSSPSLSSPSSSSSSSPFAPTPTPPTSSPPSTSASPNEAKKEPHQHDPVLPALLRLSRQIHKESHHLLYAENTFTLELSTGIHTLASLHQRSRSLIKHVVLTIPSHHDILDGFADIVRLGLRYCWGLKSFRILLLAGLPDDGRVGSGTNSVYANAFHILRWLPRGCRVLLEGCVSETVRRVVVEEGRLMNVLDETSYLKRQHQMPERH